MRRLVCALGVCLLATAACGDDAPADTAVPPLPESTTTSEAAPGTTTPDTVPDGDRLPPHDGATLVEIFEPVVAPLGFTVTRAALVDMTSYRVSPDGTHLAVYVAPVQPVSPDAYAQSYLALAAAFLPMVFERWPGLDSFDVCQEPHGWSSSGTPPSMTLLDLHRDVAMSIDWTAITLAEVIHRARQDDGLTVSAVPEVATAPTWSSAAGG